MNRFRKIFHHIKSDKIDEKIKSLDKEMERTGMVLGEVTMPMSTDNLYKIFNYANTPAVDQETSTVPDTTGFADGSSQNANGGDENDPDTWDDGWNNTTDMSNPNELNGETDRPIPITPDLSGWDGSSVSVNNLGSGGYRGIGAWTISSGIGGGLSVGTIDSSNNFIQLLIPDNIFSSYNYPVDQRGPLQGGYYASYSNTEFAAAQNIASAYEAHKVSGSVTRKVWVNYSQATVHGGPSYADYTGVKKQTTNASNGQPLYWKLKDVSILSYVNPYTSKDATPEIFSQVLDREFGVGSSYFPGNVSKLMDFLKGSLEVGKEAFDFLMDKAKGVEDLESIEKEEQEKKDKEEFDLSFSQALKLADLYFPKGKDKESVDDKITEFGDKLVSDVLSDEPPKQAARKAAMGELGVSGELTDMVNIPPEDLKNISAEVLDKGHFVDNFADALNNVKDTIVDTGRAGKLFFDYLTNNLPDVIDVDYLGQEYVDNAFASAQIKDGVVFVGDNIIGTGQSPEYDAETGEIVIRFNYDFKKNADEFAGNKDKMTWMQKTFGQALYNSIGEYSMDASIKFGPGPIGALMGLMTGSVMGKAVNLSKLLGGGKPKTGEIRMSAEKVKEMFKDGPASKNFYYQALSMDEVLMEAELQKYNKLSYEDSFSEMDNMYQQSTLSDKIKNDIVYKAYESVPEFGEIGSLTSEIDKEEAEYDKNPNPARDAAWDDYEEIQTKYKAITDPMYDEYGKSQEWYNYPEYKAAYEPYWEYNKSLQPAYKSDQGLSQAQSNKLDRLFQKYKKVSDESKAKAEKAREDYFAKRKVIDDKYYKERDDFYNNVYLPAAGGKTGYGEHKSAWEIKQSFKDRRSEVYQSDLYKTAEKKFHIESIKGMQRQEILNTKFDTPKEVKNPNENAWDNFDWSKGMDITGAGGSPGQPYTPPKEDPKNPWVPAPDTKVAGYSGSLDNWIDKTYGSGASNWYRENPGLPSERNPFIPSGSYVPKADAGGGSDTKVASAKRDKDYSLGAYVGGTGTTSKTSKKKKKKKNTMVASYKPQGELISEGWASPKHTYIDKDEKKRWFSEKDIKPEYPKEKPPKMVNGYHPKLLPQLDTPIPYIKVKNKDLLRAHKLTKDEAQKWTSLIDKLNDYIMRNPNMLAYARERYPKSDPHLAALNYKMDMQIAASDEYIETRFPENKRLYGKLMQATKRSIDLTDPKTFKSRKGKMTSINKLMRVDYVMSEYDPTDKEVKNKRIKSNKKSIGRFFRKPKKKTKSDILKDKMAVLDKEMKKTMPEG